MTEVTTPITSAAVTGRGLPRWLGPVVGAVVATAVLAAVAVQAATGGQWTPARWVLVTASTTLGAASAIPSIRSVAADPASLRPVTWTIWAALTLLAAVASARAGDWPSAVFALVGTATCATVAIVVRRRGSHTATVLDGICLLLGVAGLTVWQTLHQPDLAVLAACAGDLAALTPTLVHAWQRPAEEPTASYALIAAGGLCAAAAAWGRWAITAQAYPLYVAVSTGLVAALTLRPTSDTSTEGVVS